jgi:hypothetical protein
VAGPRTVRVLAENLDSSGLLHATAVEVDGLTEVTQAPATPPLATTLPATAVTATTATLGARVNPEGTATTVALVFGTDSALARGTTTSGQAIGSGASAVSVTAALTGLTPGTTYYYQVVATSKAGTTHGSILTFTTAATVATAIHATSGTQQSATVATAFATALQATVLDQAGDPLGGVSVTFAAPPGGASGTFSGGQTAVTETTDSNGVATAPTFVANAIVGSYTVTASVAGVSTSASFNLTNAAAAPAVIQFAGAQFSANATDGQGSIVLTRTGNLSATVTAVLSSPGGPDVAALQETVTFGPNTASITVVVPVHNDGQPNEPDASIPLALSSPGTGASLGATSAATLVVHDNNPLPAPVTVSLQLVPVKVTTGRGKKAKTKTEMGLKLTFSGAINGAGNLSAYHLFKGKTKKGVTTFNKPIPLSSVVYDPGTFTATLAPKSKLDLSQTEQLQVTASLLTDAFGRPLDGEHHGQPGSNFFASFGGKGIRIAQVRGEPPLQTLSVSAVDALLEVGPNIPVRHRSSRLHGFYSE